MSLDLAKCPLGAKSSLLGNHLSRPTESSPIADRSRELLCYYLIYDAETTARGNPLPAYSELSTPDRPVVRAVGGNIG